MKKLFSAATFIADAASALLWCYLLAISIVQPLEFLAAVVSSFWVVKFSGKRWFKGRRGGTLVTLSLFITTVLSAVGLAISCLAMLSIASGMDPVGATLRIAEWKLGLDAAVGIWNSAVSWHGKWSAGRRKRRRRYLKVHSMND